MTRAVLDANVFISAFVSPAGPPGRIIEHHLRAASFEIVLSPAIIDEVLRALAYPKLRRYVHRGGDPGLWFEDILALAELVPGETELSGVCEDPDDDKYLAAAIEGRAAFLVTGDRRLLTLQEHRGARILNPRAFLTILGP